MSAMPPRANSLVTIVVLHDLSLAASFADRLVVIHEGRVVAQGLDGQRRMVVALTRR